MRGTLSLRSAVLLAAAVLLQAGAVWGSAQGAARDWPQFGGDASGTRFSALDQVNVGNVADLRVAWVADLGFTGRVQGAPAAWDGALFVSTEWGVLALDGATGAELWRYQEGTGDRTSTGLPLQAPRGSPVVVADVGGVTVYAALPSSPAVVALAADTGELRWRTDVSNPDFAEALRTNPILAGDVLLVGPTGADLSPVPGRLVALDRASGETAWTFDLVPVAEDDPARSTWGPYPPGRRYGIGGGSAWNVGAYDPISDVVVFGTGQPIPSDNLDPRRHDGDAPVTADLYTASFVGIDAATGTLRWFHQVVPGDEWGYDQHTVPVIVDLPTDEGGVRAALLATTTGFLLVVDVTSGELLDAHRMFEGNVHLGYDDEGRPVIDEAMRRASPDDVVRVCPGSRWASIAPGAYSPLTGLLYRPNDTACSRQGSGSVPDDWQPGARPTWLLAEVRLAEDYFARWGALTALDPTTSEVAWSFDVPYPHDSGALVSAGGLVFSAFADRQFRAFDAATGELLWSQVLTAHSDAAPITYEAGGVQYVAVMAGRDTSVAGLPESGLPASITGPAMLFAFALPGAP